MSSEGMDSTFALKMEAKRLEREAARYQKEANKERNKAKAELRKGNRGSAAVHAQNAVRHEHQTQALLQMSSAIFGWATDLRVAGVTADLAKILNTTTQQMEALTKKMNLPKMSGDRTTLDGLKQLIGAANDLLTQGEGQLETEAAADRLLATLEDELTASAMAQISDIPHTTPLPAGTPANAQTDD